MCLDIVETIDENYFREVLIRKKKVVNFHNWGGGKFETYFFSFGKSGIINKINFGKKVTAYLIKNMVYLGRG